MKSPKEDYEIRKSVVSDPGTGEEKNNDNNNYKLIQYLPKSLISQKYKKCSPLEKKTQRERLNERLRSSLDSTQFIIYNLFIH